MKIDININSLREDIEYILNVVEVIIREACENELTAWVCFTNTMSTTIKYCALNELVFVEEKGSILGSYDYYDFVCDELPKWDPRTPWSSTVNTPKPTQGEDRATVQLNDTIGCTHEEGATRIFNKPICKHCGDFL